MSLNLVSCLKCIFLRGNFEDGRKVYRCRAHALKKVDISNQILCSRFSRERKKIAKKEFRHKNEKDHLKNHFDTESLIKIMGEKQETR